MKKVNYKKKCWELFSQKIRQRGADEYGNNTCVTCGKVKHWKELQAGHFIDSRNNTVLLDERLVFPQCYACNVGLHGNKIQYWKYMRKKYTEKQLYEFENLKFTISKISPKQWEEKYKQLKEQNET